MNEHAVAAQARLPIFEGRVIERHHWQVRQDDRRARFAHPKEERAVTRNETMFQDDRGVGATALACAAGSVVGSSAGAAATTATRPGADRQRKSEVADLERLVRDVL